jgi:hypothetical protein
MCKVKAEEEEREKEPCPEKRRWVRGSGKLWGVFRYWDEGLFG